VGVIVNNQDPTFMGTLEVAIVKSYQDDPEDVSSQAVQARYLSPFYGVTNLRWETGNSVSTFQETQKSYGMWMVPPDIGTRVLVIFVDGDYSQCYWIGCIADKYMNYMLPGLSAQVLPSTALSSDQQSTYGNTTSLPVAEYNKTAYVTSGFANGIDPNNAIRPVHPFANILLSQGLLKDAIRGITSSSARREAPSTVFGISTPGPLDKTPDAQQGFLTYGGETITVPASRLGGSTFVMDDGDSDGNNELVRIRTRTGHQILLHNTEDLIYIANGQGTAWIELTANGKIDIYSEDSISIHSEQDFNFRADRNINIEAGKNINIASNGAMAIQSKGDLGISATGATTLNSHGAISFSTDLGFDIFATTELKLTGSSKTNLSGGTINIGGAGTINYNAGEHKFQGSHLTHTSADKPTPATYSKVPALRLVAVPTTNGAGTLNTIMQRVPMHEPWTQHENTNSALFDSFNTDTSTGGNPIPGATPANSAAPSTVDATGAIAFTGGSGDSAHFAQTTAAFQTAFKNLAIDYKSLTGQPVILNSSFRSMAEQQALYNGWLAGQTNGYKKTVNVPGIGNVTTPVKPPAQTAHNKGIAADINKSQAAYMWQKGLLQKYGFIWGQSFNPSDPVHIQLSSSTSGPRSE
jgi:mannose-6-phosphate isomerase-like protein (cupin superfamily)